jgi:glycosyltransferase involved in cell wall biosynthesis
VDCFAEFVTLVKSILLISSIFPPQIGGPATFIDRLAHALAARHCRVSVVCATGSDDPGSDRRRPFRVHRVDRSIPWKGTPRLIARLCRELLTHDTVLVNGLEYHAALASRWVGRRFVLKVVGDKVWETARNHGLTHLDIDAFQNEKLQHPTLRTLQRQRRAALDRARLVITPSQYLRRIVIGWGVDADRVVVVHNGVDLPDRPIMPQARQTGEPLRVLFCGRLTNWKGVETLLLAAHAQRDIQVRIVGDGPEWPMLRALRDQLDLSDRVDMAGRLGPNLVRQAIAEAHVLVLTSLYEGMSHVLLEAMAGGLCCVASDRGGNPETIEHERSGLLTAAGGVSALAGSLRRLADDDALRRRLASAASQRAKQFSFDQTVQRTISMFEETAPS